jgi:hypothetical protein
MGNDDARCGRRGRVEHCTFHSREDPMDEETFNLSIRKFLKVVGVSSQREIEQAVAKAQAAGSIGGADALPATMTLEVPSLGLKVTFDGEIKLR